MKNIFILNPKAGKKGLTQKLEKEIISYFKANGGEYEICCTHQSGEGKTIANAHAKKGEPVRIFACGGDGSAFDVLNGIIGYPNAVLGVLPCGTGNDFLKYFENANLFSCLDAQMAGQTVTIDAIKAGDSYCLNQASMGLDAKVCEHKDKFSRLPFVGGKLAYTLALLYCFFTALKNKFTVQVDNNQPMSGEFLFSIAANGRYYGGGYMSAPKALVDDGLIDCVTITPVSRLRILSLLNKYTRGEHLDLPICTFLKGKKLTVTCPKEAPVNLDGEVVWGKEITFEIAPNAVAFSLPKGVGMPSAKTEKEPALTH